jgi:hypothetical protein
LNAEERALIADLEIERLVTSNAWIALEDEFMAPSAAPSTLKL